MTNIRIMESDPMIKKLLELFIDGYSDFCLAELADIILLNAREMACLPRLREEHPAAKILVMSSFPERSYLPKARHLGADGFWYQQPDAKSLHEVLSTVMEGKLCFPEYMPEVKLGLADSNTLTPREWEVLRQLVAGKTNAQIADALSCAVPTVKHHVQNLQEKTGLANRVQLAVCARARGLVIPEEVP